MNKWDLRKLRNIYKAKDTIYRTKWQSTEWENICTIHTSDRGLILKIYEELKKLDINEKIIHLKNGVDFDLSIGRGKNSLVAGRSASLIFSINC